MSRLLSIRPPQVWQPGASLIADSSSGRVKFAARFQSATPFIIAPTGTMANNGAITLGTALSTTLASCYLNLPANAIQAGSAAGWYYAAMSSASVGQVFNNTYVSGTPTIPAAPVAFVSTGPGAYTGVTSAIVGPSLSIPGGTLGPNGVLRVTSLWNLLNNADAKTSLITFGGTTISNCSLASVGSLQTQTLLYNRGSSAINASIAAGNVTGLGGSAGVVNQTAINTAAAQTLALGATMATATDYIELSGYLVEVLQG